MRPKVKPSPAPGEGRWARTGPVCGREGRQSAPAAGRGGRRSNGRTASPIGAVGRRRGGHGDSHTPGAGTAGEREGCGTAPTGNGAGKETDFEKER